MNFPLPKLTLRLTPFVIAVGVLLGITILVRPWGNYPTNDDWQYAAILKNFVDGKGIKIHVPIAPALVGQVLFTRPIVALFGFSHTLLRLITLCIACVWLWCVDALLKLAGVSPRVRSFGLLCLVINPLFINLSLSFMTECYGYALAFLGAVFWFRGVERQAASHSGTQDTRETYAIVPWRAVLIAALCTGGAFWIRQFASVVFPALLLSTALRAALVKNWRGIWLSVPRVTAGMVIYFGTVAGYFVWAKSSSNFTTNFSGPLDDIWRFELLDLQINAAHMFVYFTFFMLPLLLPWLAFRLNWSKLLPKALLCLWLGMLALSLARLTAQNDAAFLGYHRVFPFSSNLIHNRGLGVLALTEMFHEMNQYPVFSRNFWLTVGGVLTAASVLWALPGSGLRRVKGQTAVLGMRLEIEIFAVVFALLLFGVSVQAYHQSVFDRYYIAIAVAVMLTLTILLERAGPLIEQRRRRAAVALFVLGALPLAVFTIGGTHDYFRWNDARWKLVAKATGMGIATTNLDGGYEVNGWLSWDKVHNVQPRRDGCIGGDCRCAVPNWAASIWACFDDSYRIGLSVRDGYRELAIIRPNYWLGGQPVILSRRPDGPGR